MDLSRRTKQVVCQNLIWAFAFNACGIGLAASGPPEGFTRTESGRRKAFGPLTIDEAAHRVWVEGAEISLTATEFRLLWALAGREGRVQTRGALLQDVWDMPPDLNTRTVDISDCQSIFRLN